MLQYVLTITFKIFINEDKNSITCNIHKVLSFIVHIVNVQTYCIQTHSLNELQQIFSFQHALLLTVKGEQMLKLRVI